MKTLLRLGTEELYRGCIGIMEKDYYNVYGA